MDITDDLNISDEDEQVITPAKLIEMLRQAWRNEKLCPDLLPHQSEIVESVFAQISAMEKNLENLDSSDFCLLFHRTELERIRYLLSSYLRTRLEKLQRYAWAILNEEETRLKENQEGHLSENEMEFLKEYTNSIEEHLDLVGLRFLPESLQQMDKTLLQSSKPNLNSHVFCKVLTGRSIRGLVIGADHPDNETEVDLESDTQHIIQYRYIANYVKSGYVDLI